MLGSLREVKECYLGMLLGFGVGLVSDNVPASANGKCC
jgi:hypothetical protein